MPELNPELELLAVNTIRFLSADAVEQAASGHPGLPMGAAAMAHVLWTRHLRHNPANPHWFDRDRFILSGGHGCMLLYSLLHLSGYQLSLEEIRRFRQWGSITPGHPERGLTPGVELTTGPLGQGFATGVGMAIAATHLAALFNQPGHEIVSSWVYAIVTDGDLMEGVASEAASLAGHLRLGRLIYLYDDNKISIDGSTDLAFTEDRAARFEAYGWHVQRLVDGNDLAAVNAAITAAKLDPRPSLIVCPTTIGFGSPGKQGTARAHGEPLGEAELNAAKDNLAWPREPRFLIPEQVLTFYRRALPSGGALEADWQARVAVYRRRFPAIGAELDRRIGGILPDDWPNALPSFAADSKGMATRASSGQVLNALALRLPELVGGSADLTGSNNTRFDGAVDFSPATPSGRYLRFGVREHGMGAILNGLAAFGGLIPFGGTFLVFSDYMRPAIRLAALSNLPAIYVFTHDSIGLGEDGPTHQPVEHLAALRAIPGLTLIRPADANEVSQAWRLAIENRGGPTALVLTRQAVPTLPGTQAQEGVARGAYVLADFGTPEMILMASGSEVSLALEAGRRLAAEGRGIRVVSFPSWELFEQQDSRYRDSVLPPALSKRLVVEAGVGQGWERYASNCITLTGFGASAPYKDLFDHFGFTVASVVERARTMLVHDAVTPTRQAA